MKKTLFLLFFSLLFVVQGRSQGGVFQSRTHEMAELPTAASNLSVVSGNLYLYSGNLLLQAQRRQEAIVGFMVDTDFVKYDATVNYVVRHPVSGDIYFTSLDRKGRSLLYVGRREGRRYRAKRIKLDDIEVEHPSFSPDGNILVFASKEKRRSYGGYDLWYSELKGDEWTTPVNMGNRVNSPADDLSPFISGDYLFFSSNGRPESRNRLNIFATRLVATHATGDTVGMLQIGRSRVQQLPIGINSAASDCHDFVVDPHSGISYWVNAQSGIRSYTGSLEAVMQWGYVYDSQGQPLSGVAVQAYLGDAPVAAAASDADGFYRICIPLGLSCNIRFSLPNHYSYTHPLVAIGDGSGNLIGETRRDITLESLPVGRPILYSDLFGPDAVVELSPHGVEALAPLVRFLTDNPNLEADMVLSCDLTEDIEFNALLTDRRLLVLGRYLVEQLPPSFDFSLTNGCRGRVGCDSASASSRLTVLLKQ